MKTVTAGSSEMTGENFQQIDHDFAFQVASDVRKLALRLNRIYPSRSDICGAALDETSWSSGWLPAAALVIGARFVAQADPSILQRMGEINPACLAPVYALVASKLLDDVPLHNDIVAALVGYPLGDINRYEASVVTTLARSTMWLECHELTSHRDLIDKCERTAQLARDLPPPADALKPGRPSVHLHAPRVAAVIAPSDAPSPVAPAPMAAERAIPILGALAVAFALVSAVCLVYLIGRACAK